MNYSAVVKFPVTLALLFASGWLVPAQTNDMNLDDVLDSVQSFAQENLDENVLRALQQVDRTQVEDFLKNYQTFLNGDYVLDVAQLKEAANVILPLLEAHEETQPYAAWLRSRLDYFDAAEELKALTPAPKSEPGQPVPLLPNPSFKMEQEIWIKKVSPRPWPEKAAAFVPKLKNIFVREGVPAALVWLAEVESGFDASARSPAGALGLFQLMPATAKQYGLSLWPRDQRRQTAPAAHAAAQDLKQLHEQFGDWRLALAAYNSGAGTVEKLLKRYDTKSYERIAPHLPAETQMYVPKVEATILHREGLELEKLKMPSGGF
jgi:membrane-bound lytic murein transglycosylase D